MLIQLTRLIAVMVIGVTLPVVSMPDEGMWPFDGLPLKELKEKYNFEPTPAWLEHVRLGSVRFDTGGSGSFVSPNGLVMTNHHVALETLQKVSTQEKDWVKDGFSSRMFGSEVKGTDLTLRQLIEVKNVTKEVLAVAEEQRKELLEGMCEKLKDDAKHIVADSVVLYDGGEFRIHVYHIFDDVRVVFAPEKQVAFFGGDPDNFTYPRYDLDCAFFRVYEDDKPVDSSKFYFKWNAEGAKTDELIFVSGHPGKTERALTYAEMEFHRDLNVPRIVKQLHTMRDNMKKKMAESSEQAFKLRDEFFGIENSLKAYEGHLAGLRDPEMMGKMKARDEELIEKSGKPEVKAAFDEIEKAMADFQAMIGDKKAMIGDKKAKMADRQKFQKSLQEEILPKNKAIITKARFDTYGTAMYPDATFTLRLSYGTVKEYSAGTTRVPPKTTFNGLYERNAAFDNESPFDLPQRWLDAKSKIKLNTPINFICTADIIGGNSGSPILNRNAELVGLVFDGNIESLPGNYWFDERVNRCVAVHSAGMIEAIQAVYGEADLAKELLGMTSAKQ